MKEELFDLEQVIIAKYDQARQAWPEVELERDAFTAFVQERLGGLASLADLPGDDLYLVCACGRGDPQAIGAFDRAYLRPLHASLVRIDIPLPVAHEVQQILRERLLASTSAKVTDYAGTGDLRSWVHVIALREALHLLRRGKKEVPLSEQLLGALSSPMDDPELMHMKELYQSEFRQAFLAALRELTPRERNLLRHQVVNRLQVNQIGAIYRVHRATAARWLDQAHSHLVAETQRILMERLRVDRGAYESIVRLIRSQLDVSLGHHLGEPE